MRYLKDTSASVGVAGAFVPSSISSSVLVPSSIISSPDVSSNLSSSDFFSAIIHEIKNPLNVIMGFAQILGDEKKFCVSAEERAEYIKDINDSARELNELIHDLLDVKSLESGNFSVDVGEKIDIKEIVRRSVRLNYKYAQNRKINLVCEVDESLILVNLDAKRMKQILSNLISNAIKYSPENTEVKILVRQVTTEPFTTKLTPITTNTTTSGGAARGTSVTPKKHLEITVADQGFGMTESQLQTAFVKYKTIENPNTGKVDSFGLGLPITKQLVEAQGGTISVKSQPNKGTEVCLRFCC